MKNDISKENEIKTKISEENNVNMENVNKVNIKEKSKELRDYPAIDIEEAINVTKQLDRYGGKAKPSDLGALLNRKGGWLGVTIASSKRYRFIEGRGELIITDLGKKAIHPTYSEEDKEAMKEAFFNVKLFKEIYERFKGNYLEDEMFANFLIRNYNIKDRKEALRLANIIKRNTALIQIEVSEGEKVNLETSQTIKEIRNKDYSSTKVSSSLFNTIMFLGVLEGIGKATFNPQMNKEDVRFTLEELYKISKNYPSLNSLVEYIKEELNNKEMDYKDVLKKYPSLIQRLLKDLGIQKETNSHQDDLTEGSASEPAT